MSGAMDNSGQLRERITVERPANARDAIGAQTGAASSFGEYWAAVEPFSPGSESEADARTARGRWEITMRRAVPVQPGDTVHWAGRQLRVMTVQEQRLPNPMLILKTEEI